MWTTRLIQQYAQRQPTNISRLGQLKLDVDAWLLSKWGRRFRVTLLAATISVYPCYRLLVNGPLVGRASEWRTPQEELPPHLQELVNEVGTF